MESSQLYAATLTHYSTELLTTGPDYDPLLLLLALVGDVQPNPGPSRYPCSVCFKNVTSQGISYLCTRCSHWVHSRCPGLRNAAEYRKANGWICNSFWTTFFIPCGGLGCKCVILIIVEALHGSHVFCLSSHVRWRCARAQRENTKRILLLSSYGNIICRHLQICFFSGLYNLMDIHFGSILLCNSNPDADR